MHLADKAGLWTGDRQGAAREVEKRLQADGISVVRLSFADQHGILRGKTYVAGEIAGAMRSGVGFSATMLMKDTSHRTVFSVWGQGGAFGGKEWEGAADVVMLPDPSTFRVLPWAPHTGWMLCDIVFSDGRPVPLGTRHLYRQALSSLADAGYDFFVGLEVEFHLFKLEKTRLALEDAAQPGQPGPAPEVSLLNQGYQYLTEQRYDEMDPILEILRINIAGLGLPLRSLEVEFGPSQVEFTFRAGTGLEPADAMVLFRSATKQVAQRHGYHATFMCRPKIPNVMSSGWHLHQSLIDRKTGANALHGCAGPPLACGNAMDGWPARPRARRGRIQYAHRERLRALSSVLARPRPRHLGTRKSRRHGARAGRSWRCHDASREPRR